VSSNNDRLSPAGDKLRDILAENGFSEDGTVEVVSDSTIGGLPHLLKLEFFNSSLIRSDCGTLDTDLALFDGSGSIESYFIISGISVFHAEVEIFNVNVEEGKDELVLDVLPDDSGHLITVEFGYGVFNLDLLDGSHYE